MTPNDPLADAPEDVVIRVNRICNRFEERWQSGEQPGIEEALADGDDSDRDLLLRELLPIEMEYRQRTGVRLAVADYASRFADLDRDWLARLIDQAAHNAATASLGTDLAIDRLQEQIDGYRIVESIGEGGFGVVYLAEQHMPVRRQVALKVIKPGMDTKQVIARFEVERQALALMDHPGIAKVLDAGTTDSGRPFFVMELVRGIPITDYCDRWKLSIAERLELFLSVCDAVQHAHQKGIIHRDIKPTNVLVAVNGGNAVPKIIDFGVAKAINQRLTDQTLRTGLTQIVGTPLYMSPEQAEKSVLDIDTRSDIYSLGVLLFELLTGTTPIERSRLANANYDEIQRVIREEDPPRPSSRLSTIGADAVSVAENRGCDPRKLPQMLRGDLDWIVMKALEKDRTRRYVSAAAFADDVQRHLDNLPIEAGAPTLLYRVGKFSKRNQTAITVAVMVTVLLILTSVVGIWQAAKATRAQREADAARKRAEAVSGFLVETFRSPDPSVDGQSVTVVERLDRAVRDLSGKFPNDPITEASMLHALGETYLGLGLPNKATGLLEQAQSLRDRNLGSQHPNTLESGHALARAYAASGNLGDAIEFAERVVEGRLSKQPDDAQSIAWMNDLSDVYARAGRTDEAIELSKQVYDLRRETLGIDHPDTLESMTGLGRALQQAGMVEEARAIFEENLMQRQNVLGNDHPDTLQSMYLLALVHTRLGSIGDAVRLHRDTLEGRRSALGTDHPDTVASMNALAFALRRAGRQDEAIETYNEVLQARSSVAPRVLSDLGFTHAESGNLDDAIAHWQQAADRWRAGGVRDEGRLNTLESLAIALGRKAEWQAARSILEEQLALETNLTSTRATHAMLRLGAVLSWLDEMEALESYGLQMLERLGAITDPTVADRFTKAFLAKPLPPESTVMQSVLELGSYVGERAKGHQFEPFFHMARGITEYRRGHYQRAAELLRDAVGTSEHSRFPALYFQAMAEYQSGNQPRGRQMLKTADLAAVTLLGSDESTEFRPIWHVQLICMLARDEAHALIHLDESEVSIDRQPGE